MFTNKKSKLLLIILLTICLIAPLSFADNEIVDTPNTTTEVPSAEATTDDSEVTTEDIDNTSEDVNIDDSQQANQEIHEGDLYLFDSDVVMDKLVNGNVYIMGNTVKVSGQVAGNVFVFANKVDFEEAYIQSSAYICANEVNFKAVASDLYICCNTLNIPSDFGVYRDLKSVSRELVLLGIIGRNVDCTAASISLSQDDKKAQIYGNFNYSSTSEIEIPEGVVEKETNFTKIETNENKVNVVSDYIMPGVVSIVFSIAVFGILIWLAKDTAVKCTKIASSVKWNFISLGLAILSFVVVPVASIILLITTVGSSITIALVGLFILLLLVAKAVAIVAISNVISNKFKITNNWLKLLVVAGLTLVVYLIGLIPILGVIVNGIIKLLGLGYIIVRVLFKNSTFEKKEKTEKVKKENKVVETKTEKVEEKKQDDKKENK